MDIQRIIVKIKTPNNRGTGVIIEGLQGKLYIITCFHIIRNNNEIEVYGFNPSDLTFSIKIEINIILKLERNLGDLAVLEITSTDKNINGCSFPLKERSTSSIIKVKTYGFPSYGKENGMPCSVDLLNTQFLSDNGIPQKKLRDANSITSGFSGAPIISENKEILGLISHIINSDKYNRGSDVAFVVPSSFIMQKLIDKRIVQNQSVSINRQQQLSVDTPLLIGSLLDFSKSSISNIFRSQQNSTNQKVDFEIAINSFISKIIAFCESSDSSKILPLIKVFLYGTGFGKVRKALLSFFEEISNLDQGSEITQSSNMRDLFFKAGESYPLTPSAEILKKYNHYYKANIKDQLIDAGTSISNFEVAFEEVLNRFLTEMGKGFYYGMPYLFVITDGNGISNQRVREIINDIKNLGVFIVIGLVSSKDVIPYKKLLSSQMKTWDMDVKELYNMASEINNQDLFQEKFINHAKLNGWDITQGSKMLFQITSVELIDAFIESFIVPLRKS